MELDELRSLVQEGIDSGPCIDEALVFSRLREKYARMVRENIRIGLEQLDRGERIPKQDK